MDQAIFAAYIQGQAALLNCELAMMEAANHVRRQNGLADAYSDYEYAELLKRFEGELGYNAISKQAQMYL